MVRSDSPADVFLETHERSDLEWLDRAWSSPETFAFAPSRSALETEQIATMLDHLPGSLRSAHFGLLTSGSTGQPKLVIGSRERAEKLARVLHEIQEGEPVAETILALPLAYCYAFVNQWLWARIHDRRIVRTNGFSEPDRLIEALERATDAMICMVGIQVPLLLEYCSGKRFPGVRRVHFAGGRFPQDKLDVIAELFPNASVFNNYGCAEAMPRLTVRRATDASESRIIGKPLPGVELRAGEAGEILFRSPFGSVGWVDGDGFHSIGPDDWVATGDLGHEGEGGQWVIDGRANEVFKRHGEKISLPQLLDTVRRSWRAAAAFFRETDANGEEGHVLVLAPAPDRDALREILHELRAHHPRAQWPIRIEGMASLPLLPNGKPDINSLARAAEKTILWRQRI